MHYARLCEAYAAIEATRKRLEKTRIIAALLKETQDLEPVILLLQGRVFSEWDRRTIGISSKLMVKALARTTGSSTQELERTWKRTGDLGLVAEQHSTGKQQQTLLRTPLTVRHVYEQIQKLAAIEGTGSVDTKLKTISELLSNATPQEAKYVTRTILEVLRIGIAKSTLRDAILHAYLPEGLTDGVVTERDAYTEAVKHIQEALDRTNDFVRVADAARRGKEALAAITIEVGKPLQAMLGVRGKSITEAMERLGTPILLQYKYDGFRMSIHKNGARVLLFTRRLEDVTAQFPEVADRVRKHVNADTCILDAEAIGIDPETGTYRPFQEISQRIRRKHDIKEMAEKLPVDIRVFDILYVDGKELLNQTQQERHQLLTRTVKNGKRIGIAHSLITSEASEGQAFFDQALANQTEGLMAKKLDAPYEAGLRVGNWMKIKTTMEPLDLVVVGAEWGEGKRSGWLTSFILACRDDDGSLLEIGRAATGLKELPEEGFSFKEITEILTPLIEYEEGRLVHVRPHVILEVGYEEIQKSPSYASGYALRFPRILRNRTDERGVEDCTSLTYIEQLYQG